MPGDQLAWPEQANQGLFLILEVRFARKGIHRWAILLLERKAGKPCFPIVFKGFPMASKGFISETLFARKGVRGAAVSYFGLSRPGNRVFQ